LNKKVLVNFRGVAHQFQFNELEMALFFTCIDENRIIHATSMDGLKVSMKPDQVDSVIVFDEGGEVEFDSRDNEDSIEDDENFDVENFMNDIKQIEFEIDTINKLATALEKKYPFVKVSIDFEVDEDTIEDFVASYQG